MGTPEAVKTTTEAAGTGIESLVSSGEPADLAGATAASKILTGPYLGQLPPGDEPALFAPDVVNTGMNERDVAITPDGKEFYFGLLGGGYAAILVSRQVDGVWTAPEVAPFSANPDYLDLEPHITPDGKRFLFLSTRPAEGVEYKPGWENQDIWVMDRTENGWSEPYNLGPPVNSEAAEFFPSVTRDGTIYFTREVVEEGKQRHLIHRARFVDGKYAEPERLPEAVNPGDAQYNALIAPDERFLIVCMAGREDAIGRSDYYVVFRDEDDTWTGPVNLGPRVNTPGNTSGSPSVSPDGRYFFFASSRTRDGFGLVDGQRDLEAFRTMQGEPQNGNGDIYWMDASFIDELRP